MILLVLPNRNSIRNDYGGGFYPWARLFQERHESTMVRFDLDRSKAVRRRDVLIAIDQFKPDTICFFTHGLRKSLPQLGWTTENCAELASAIRKHATGPRIVLYSCLAGAGEGPEGDGGFADTLRDSLCAAGAVHCQIDAHTTSGRADANPYVRRFRGDGRPEGGLGGQWLVSPSSPLWPRWRTALQGRMRWDFPFLTQAEILDRLEHGNG